MSAMTYEEFCRTPRPEEPGMNSIGNAMADLIDRALPSECERCKWFADELRKARKDAAYAKKEMKAEAHPLISILEKKYAELEAEFLAYRQRENKSRREAARTQPRRARLITQWALQNSASPKGIFDEDNESGSAQ